MQTYTYFNVRMSVATLSVIQNVSTFALYPDTAVVPSSQSVEGRMQSVVDGVAHNLLFR
jgi:hypothetical protein